MESEGPRFFSWLKYFYKEGNQLYSPFFGEHTVDGSEIR